jgi:hypothetical protein
MARNFWDAEVNPVGICDTLLTVLTSDVVLEPVLAVLVAYGIKTYQSGRRNQLVSQTILDLVDYIEEHYKEWGITGSEKLNRFLELFIDEFQKQMGRQPNKNEIQSAVIKAEAHVQRARRETVFGGIRRRVV